MFVNVVRFLCSSFLVFVVSLCVFVPAFRFFLLTFDAFLNSFTCMCIWDRSSSRVVSRFLLFSLLVFSPDYYFARFLFLVFDSMFRFTFGALLCSYCLVPGFILLANVSSNG